MPKYRAIALMSVEFEGQPERISENWTHIKKHGLLKMGFYFSPATELEPSWEAISIEENSEPF